MGDVGILNILFDKTFLATAAAAIFAFATIVTLGLPLIERDGLGDRLKAVSRRREELRAKHHAALSGKRASLRVEPSTLMKSTLDKLKLTTMLESEDSREKLARAGYRGQAPLIAFMFFRFVMPGIVFLVTLFYLFVVTHFHWATMMKVSAAFAGALIGYYLPDLFISNATSRRQQSIMRAFPDALDLMLICVETGTQSSELAEELGLTTAELSYLPDRAQAFDNLAKRCGHSGVKAVAIALNQAEKYGTPMGQALRVTSQENREMRMQEAEQKAASLPAKLTVPMILFFLPCLFVVILGPAIMKIMHTFGHH